MSIIVVATTPGVTAEQYDQVTERLNLGGKLPAGCTAHIAGEGPEGWQVISVWDSPEAVAKFNNETLFPTFRELGITPPPKPPVVYPLYKLVT